MRERRLGGEKEEARKVMDAIMNPPKTAWGRKKVDALMENAELLGAEGNNKQAAEFANALIQKLLPRIDSDNRTKEIYLQCYYIVVENVYRQAQKLKEKAPDKYAKGVTTAATLAVDLAKKQAGFVNDATRNRFRDLMDAEPELKAAFVNADVAALETAAKQADAVKDKSPRQGGVGRGVDGGGPGKDVAGLRRRRRERPRDGAAGQRRVKGGVRPAKGFGVAVKFYWLAATRQRSARTALRWHVAANLPKHISMRQLHP